MRIRSRDSWEIGTIIISLSLSILFSFIVDLRIDKLERGEKKRQRNKEIFTFLGNWFSISIFAFIAFEERDRDRGFPSYCYEPRELLSLLSILPRQLWFNGDNCSKRLSQTTFIHSRLPRPIRHYFGWDRRYAFSERKIGDPRFFHFRFKRNESVAV